MKGIRDYSSLVDALGYVKSVLFVHGDHYLCKSVVDALDELTEYETLQDLIFDVKIPVLYAMRYVSGSLLDDYYLYGKNPDDVNTYDRIQINQKILKSIKVLL